MRTIMKLALSFLATMAMAVSLTGCGNSKPPAASIEAPPLQTAEEWLTGGWNGTVEIDEQAINRTQAITDEHVNGIKAAKMQFYFQPKNQVAISVSVPTPKGPVARNAMANWKVTAASEKNIKLRIKHKNQPIEEVVIDVIDDNTFTMPASEHFGRVRFVRIPKG
jgi:hypothetical protein